MQDTNAIRRCGDWAVKLQQLNNGSWMATATTLLDYEKAEGRDAEQTLIDLADRIGLLRQEVKRAFGL